MNTFASANSGGGAYGGPSRRAPLSERPAPRPGRSFGPPIGGSKATVVMSSGHHNKNRNKNAARADQVESPSESKEKESMSDHLLRNRKEKESSSDHLLRNRKE